MKGIGRVAVLAMVVGVALAASSAYADQPADRGSRSTTVSTDGAIWGGSGHWGSPPVEQISLGQASGRADRAEAHRANPGDGTLLNRILGRIGSLLEGAIWGFSPPVK